MQRLKKAQNKQGWSGWEGGEIYSAGTLEGPALSEALAVEANASGRGAVVVNAKGSLEGWGPKSPKGYMESPAYPIYIACDSELSTLSQFTKGHHGVVDPFTVARIRKTEPELPQARTDIELALLLDDEIPEEFRNGGRERRVFARPEIDSKELSDILYLLALNNPGVECVVVHPDGNLEGWFFSHQVEMLYPVFRVGAATKRAMPTFTPARETLQAARE